MLIKKHGVSYAGAEYYNRKEVDEIIKHYDMQINILTNRLKLTEETLNQLQNQNRCINN